MENNSISSPLKWAGGKRKFSPIIIEAIKDFKTKFDYHEPFFGGGSIFFSLHSSDLIKNSYINDVVPQLVNFYKVLSKEDYLQEFIKKSKNIESKFNMLLENEDVRKEEYYKLRKTFNNNFKKLIENDLWIKNPNITLAVQLLALNKLCFNGMFRLNSKGEFNIPIGTHKKVRFVNEDNLKRVSKSLESSKISCKDYKHTGAFSKELNGQNLIFLDPPYIPNSPTSSFTDYSSEGFNYSKHKELSKLFSKIIKTDAKVILTNNNNSISQDLFVKNNNVYSYNIPITKTISADPNKRGKTNELLLSNFKITTLEKLKIN